MNFEAIPRLPQWKLCRSEASFQPAQALTGLVSYASQMDPRYGMSTNSMVHVDLIRFVHEHLQVLPVLIISKLCINKVSFSSKVSIMFQNVEHGNQRSKLRGLFSRQPSLGRAFQVYGLKVRFDAFDPADLKWVLGFNLCDRRRSCDVRFQPTAEGMKHSKSTCLDW